MPSPKGPDPVTGAGRDPVPVVLPAGGMARGRERERLPALSGCLSAWGWKVS